MNGEANVFGACVSQLVVGICTLGLSTSLLPGFFFFFFFFNIFYQVFSSFIFPMLSLVSDLVFRLVSQSAVLCCDKALTKSNLDRKRYISLYRLSLYSMKPGKEPKQGSRNRNGSRNQDRGVVHWLTLCSLLCLLSYTPLDCLLRGRGTTHSGYGFTTSFID